MKLFSYLSTWTAILATLPSGSANEEKLITDQVDWLRANGGKFHEGLEIRQADDGTGRYAMFATKDMSEDELLIELPRKLIVTAGADEGSYGGIWCPTVRNLMREMKAGDKSDIAPYANYLNAQSRGQLPTAWSGPGQKLLLRLLNMLDNERENDLKPLGPLDWYREWLDDCEGSDDPFELNAAMILVQRGWDDLMLPVFDMMSHRNGHYLNTKNPSVHKDKDKPILVQAMRDIKTGEEIYTSYTDCVDCGNRIKHNYGTPEMLRDYGFVENFPQRYFLGGRFSFILDEILGEDGKPTGKLQVEWLTKKKPGRNSKVAMRSALEHLSDVGAFYLESPPDDVPLNELYVIRDYHKALTVAITHALEFLNFNTYVGADCDSPDNEDGVCAVSMRYDDLGWRPDDLGYAVYTCDTDESMSYEGFKRLEKTHSHYQKIDYLIDPKNDNVCFDISNIIQMCGSYRPFYHEMVVHHTARYLPGIKRVLWVGGGDSMLLHEILKYPSLEFVVGLEIDQVVTRLSFKHLGTQPHFDNPKVQWWFGDAAKSLLLLPDTYFGSFDMVLVDLSETVTSGLVTDELNIMQALSLLLKPEGILVKNELYMEQMAAITKYSVQIHFPSMPVMCSQCLILGSQKTDFLYETLTDHELNAGNLYIPDQKDIKDRYEYFHDYRRNATAIHLCKENDEDDEELPTEQKRSPGVLMILEVEDAEIDLSKPDDVIMALVKAAERDGFSMVSTAKDEHPLRSTLKIVLAEGYILARSWTKHKYCAIDIHLWSDFEKQDDLNKALVKALGSPGGKSSSAYRIVAGGMFGLSRWKEEQKKRGPRVTESCEGEKETDRPKAMDAKVFGPMLEETIALLPEKDYTVAVVCGHKEGDCSSLKVLKGTKAVKKVVPLMTCNELAKANEYEQDILQKMIDCEKQIFKSLTESVDADNKVRAIIIDPSASYIFTRVAYKTFKATKIDVLAKESFVLTAMFANTDDWRRNFMERFRKDIILEDPVFRVEALFNSTDSSVEMDLTYSGEQDFVHKLVDAAAKIEKKTGLVADVRDIKGGLFVEDPDWAPSHFFLPEDYDQRGPLEQYMSQVPVGYQTVFQLFPKTADTKISLNVDSLKHAVKSALSGISTSVATWQDRRDMNAANLYVTSDTGDGGLVTAMWSTGNCVALWDGRDHVDLNLFTYVEDEPLADNFFEKFNAEFKEKFVIGLRDVQPRGFGRVVNFPSDIGAQSVPHWAKFKE